jgi:hypothetical protein
MLTWSVKSLKQRDRMAQTQIQNRSENKSFLQLFIEQFPGTIALLNQKIRYLFLTQKWSKKFSLEGQDFWERLHYEMFSNALYRNQQLLKSIPDNTKICIFIKKYPCVDGCYLLANQQFQNRFKRDSKANRLRNFFPEIAIFFEKSIAKFLRVALQIKETAVHADGLLHLSREQISPV